MIITKLIGGVGNQMFQYAAGRRAAYINNTTLKLDITAYENQIGITPRKYMLYIFNINESFANDNEIQKLKKQSRNPFFKIFPRFTSKIIPYYRQSYIRQRNFEFDENILKIRKNCYLEGYWTSEKYFKDISDVIRNEFTLKNEPDKENKEMIKRISGCNSVSIHVRHGDYIHDRKTCNYHGVCGLSYYKKAISLIIKRIANPSFFIFSDDPKWCKVNLRLKFPTYYVTHNLGKKDSEDMRLMSACEHNIIANSSFSWWGAWLTQTSQKLVIAPKQWFRDITVDTNTFTPNSWITINN